MLHKLPSYSRQDLHYCPYCPSLRFLIWNPRRLSKRVSKSPLSSQERREQKAPSKLIINVLPQRRLFPCPEAFSLNIAFHLHSSRRLAVRNGKTRTAFLPKPGSREQLAHTFRQAVAELVSGGDFDRKPAHQEHSELNLYPTHGKLGRA